MVITVFGLGFVGLTTAVGLADTGIIVYGVDVEPKRKELIASGKLPFLEPGLDKALVDNLNKTFFVTDNYAVAVEKSDCILFCVGTPYGVDGEADLTYLFSAIDMALVGMKDKKIRVLVTKSTIPPSTTKERIIPYVENSGLISGVDVGIANNPEFLREGYCWDDFMNADRIVLGVSDSRSEKMLRELYKDFNAPIHAVSLNTGEFIKYLSNTTLATLISFANEMSLAADTIGDIDAAQAFRIFHQDKRWGNGDMKSYLYPGCGYGGYCLPKDANAFYSSVKAKGFDGKILLNVIKTNEQMAQNIAKRIEKRINSDAIIGILGLSFKPGSDDVRDTPSAKIISALIADGYANIVGYDPIANQEFEIHYPELSIKYADSLTEIINLVEICVITTAWAEFRDLDKKTSKYILDCRYLL